MIKTDKLKHKSADNEWEKIVSILYPKISSLRIGQIYRIKAPNFKFKDIAFVVKKFAPHINSVVLIYSYGWTAPMDLTVHHDFDYEFIAEYPNWQEAVKSKEFREFAGDVDSWTFG